MIMKMKKSKLMATYTSIDERWEKGIPHDRRSEKLYRAIAALDFENGDSFCFKSGGDGDNGEQLMYLLDVYFEQEDRES